MLTPHPTIDAIDTIHRPSQTAQQLGYRCPAEFEPVDAVWVVPPHNEETWPGCFEKAQAQHAAWVELMQPYVEVKTPGSLGIQTDDAWIRDFGPIFVVKGSGAEGPGGQVKNRSASALTTLPLDPLAPRPLALHDFHFNSWGAKYEEVRPLDDVVPQHLAAKLGLPLWVHDFVLEGGSIDVNGKGAVMTTQQCLFNANRNPWATRDMIEQKLHETLGTRHVIWLPGGIAGDDTDGHIDDVARFVSPQCVAVVVAPEDHPDHAMTQRNLQALQQAKDQGGEPLHIVGLPTPEPIVYDFPNLPSVQTPAPVPASYANFLIANDAVFVPVFGQATDEVACGVLEKVLPGRTIVPVRAEHLVVGLGALHCLSMQQPAKPIHLSTPPRYNLWMPILLRRALLLIVVLLLALTWGDYGSDVLGQADPANDPTTDIPETPTGPPDKVPASSGSAAGGLSVPAGGLIAVVEIDGPILYPNQLDSLQRRTDRAIQDGADLIVFDLDTPGGALIIALDMSAYIRTLPVPTVAWVDNQALSAGILIGSACDELVMATGSLTGDCAPIVPGQNLAPTERAKALSPLLAEFRANAADNYNGSTTSDYALFHAMCVLGVEVYQVKHTITGELRLVSQADYAIMVDGKSPVDAAGIGQSSTSALSTTDESVPVGRPIVTVTDASEVGQWELVKQIHNGTTLLTMNEIESLDAGLSRATVSSEAELKNLYGAGRVQRYEETWSESLVGFLVNPFVRAALLLLGIIGVLLEYFSPGLFVPGIVGVAAFAVLIGAPFLVGLAQTWHLLLIVVGIALVVYEMFTMTTFGVLAVLGLLMFIAGLVLSGVQTASNGLPEAGAARQVMITSLSFVGAIVLTVPALFIMTRYFGSLPLLNKLVLTESQHASLATAGGAVMPHQRVSGDEVVGGGKIKPGMTGVVTRTGLRPAGNIEIDDQLIDVTSTGGFVEAGTTVRVLEVHGSMIMVEPVQDNEDA